MVSQYGQFPGTERVLIAWIVSGAFTITALPLLLLAAYSFRLMTLAKRTLSIGLSVLRPSEDAKGNRMDRETIVAITLYPVLLVKGLVKIVGKT